MPSDHDRGGAKETRDDAGPRRRQPMAVDLRESSGISDAPNVTVLDWICLMPPPEPID
jgi:hypothetical protein